MKAKTNMKEEINKNLKNLIGLPLWSIGRAGSIYWFVFGNQRRLVTMRNGKQKIVSDYSLHVQCDWRVCIQDKPYITSRDINYPSGDDPYKDIDNFDYDAPGGNRLEEQIASFFKKYSDQQLIVTSVEGNNTGDLKIQLNDNVEFFIFINDSVIEEYWRFFIPYTKDKHFVVTNNGIEYH